MQERLGEEFPAFLRSYDRPPQKGLRINPLKIDREDFLSRAPFPLGEQIGWERCGYYHAEEKAGRDPYHFAGLYYLQEPSAMYVGKMTEPCRKTRVLDLCAAPGGKTTQLAAQMAGSGILIANEIDPARAKILSQNVERWGAVNCAVTNAAPRLLSERFPSYFDLILVDAPCSGEGMFKKEPEALTHWSLQNVRMCAARQYEILEAAASMLAAGGELVYSTCTFAEEEDEWQIERFLREHSEFVLCAQEKLYPHRIRGEGHFAARMRKVSGEISAGKPYAIRRDPRAEQAFRAFAEDCFEKEFPGEIAALADGRMYLPPPGMPSPGVRTLRLGVELGEWDGKLFRPAHALAMAYGTQARRKLRLSREDCAAYLRGETLNTDLPNGWCVVCVEEFSLGFAKVTEGVAKNHLPKGLRLIR